MTLTRQELESKLWQAADILRGQIDAADYKNYIFSILFLSPNPPKDTDGRREDSGRGWVRELQGRWPGVLG